MKFKFATIVVFGLFFVSMTSCEEEKKIAITSDVFGKAVATPSTVRNGDEINLSIGDVAVSGSVTVDGKEYYPIVHYLIGDKEVAVSAEKEMPFSAIYGVNNLTVDEREYYTID